MPAVGNTRLALAISNLFASDTDSDCVILFCEEEHSRNSAGHSDGASSRPTTGNNQKTSIASPASAEPAGYGDPIPAHMLILRNVSERFKAQFERWAEGAEQATKPKHSSAGLKPRPVLRVPLGSEAEVPSARAAIRFAYTGQVEAGSIREVLEVRRQGAYLQIEGCAAECDELILARLAASNTNVGEDLVAQGGMSLSIGTGGSGSGPATVPQPAVLDLYACEQLWPDPSEEPSFESILLIARQQLLTHFGDTLATLNTPLLRQQLLALPAVAVEALLESDDFGTDCESSVLLLLATWMEVNHGKTDAATRQRLCRHIRLVQLSRPYLLQILPGLALHHRIDPQGSNGWFPISFNAASYISALSTAGEAERAAHFFVNYDHKSPWYNTTPRRQCLPPTGRTFNWSISQQDLQKSLERHEAMERRACADKSSADLKPASGDTPAPSGTDTVSGHGSVSNSIPVSQVAVREDCIFEGPVGYLTARGFLWRPFIESQWIAMAGGLYLRCLLPSAVKLAAQPGDNSLPDYIASIDALLAVDTWEPRGHLETRQVVRVHFRSREDYVIVGGCSGFPDLLQLRALITDGESAGCPAIRGGGGGGGSSLAAWSDYLHDGKMTGTLTLLPPPAP